MLEKLSKDNMDKFVELVNNKNLKTIALIEKYITYGFLNRLEGTPIIVDGANPAKIIGNTTDEAVTFFTNTENNKDVIE